MTNSNGTTEQQRASPTRLLLDLAGWLIGTGAALGLAAGLAEAAVLLLVVRAALAISEQDGPARVDVPLAGSVPLSTALLVGLGALLVRLVLQLLGAWLSSQAYARVRLHWLSELVDHSVTARWPAVADQPEGTPGELASGVIPHAALATLNLALLAQQAGSLAILLIATFVVDAAAAVVAMAALGLLALSIRPIGKRIRVQSARAIDQEQGLASQLAEGTRAMLEVRAFGVGREVNERFRTDARRAAAIWRRVNFGYQAPVAVYQASALALILASIGILSGRNPDQVAGLGAIVLILIRAFAYGQQVQAQLAAMQAATPAVLRVEEALQLLRSAPEHSGGDAFPRPLHELRLKGAGYWYRPGEIVLHDLDLEVRAGEIVGLHGPSGAGKTTVLHLLLGLRTPRAGTFEVNENPAASVALDSWRRAVAFIPQEAMLIEGSIAENIRFFRPDLTDDCVRDAAIRAGLAPDLAGWPEGLERLVGQRRHGVSGGQRQRITIARALAGDPLVLLMDEPTSSLDEEAERVVLETLRTLRGQLTVVVAAHRASTLALCDRVVKLERPLPDGRPDPAEGNERQQEDHHLEALSDDRAQVPDEQGEQQRERTGGTEQQDGSPADGPPRPAHPA